MKTDAKVYMSPTCPYCKRVKELLIENGIEFTDLDVTKDREALKEMMDISGARSVPVVSMCNELMVGFDESKLKQMINCAKQQTSV